ncbi:MAG: hypothetical protein Q8K58_12245 [Acidimicrobiales bacterium]|nr:hypothetical protein [Acidimicrobiales bacterium]
MFGLGLGLTLALALPAAIIAQLADAVDEGDGTPAAAYPFALVVLGAVGGGGWLVGRRARAHHLATAAAVGLVAIALIQTIGIARRAAADEDVAWATVPAVTAVAVGLAVAGAALGRRWPGRTRP